VVLHEDLYDLMRVRGFFGGYFVDALAGVDIAIWDLFGKALGLPLSTLLGGQRHERLPAYVSGLPKATLLERCDLAVEWVGKGFKGIKFAAAMSDDGIVKEMAALREAVGPGIHLCVDLHWKFTAGEAVRIIRQLEAYDLYFAEAPCQPEDMEGQRLVARGIGVPLALGEEWRTAFEYRPRFEARAMSVIQPEIGHTGITEFLHIGRMAHAFHIDTIPHASISAGIFMAASLQATSALQRVPYHEYQHSIFDKNLVYTTGTMGCADGFYQLPTGPGIGVEPNDALFNHVIG
jgi:L-alanine-DL-glutamate epimerase-like enolase superfamily enzyme